MKTAFRRFLIPAVLVLLCALLLVGWVFQFSVRRHLEEQAYSSVEAAANTISRLATAYIVEDSISSNAFFLNMTVASQATGAKSAICNEQGKLIVCSDSPFGCVHQGLMIDSDYLGRVFQKGSIRSLGVVQGLYSDSRFVVSVPIYGKGGHPMGIVISSIEAEQVMSTMGQLSTTCLVVGIFAVVGSIALMGVLARKQSSPLQDMAKAANRFGHGELGARVQVNKHSPREVQELALAFNNMASSLQKSEYQRQEFVANVSHELKTPMTTIGGYIDGILDGTIEPEKEEKYLKIVSDEVKRLSRLVTSMISLSKIDSGEITVNKTSFDILTKNTFYI